MIPWYNNDTNNNNNSNNNHNDNDFNSNDNNENNNDGNNNAFSDMMIIRWWYDDNNNNCDNNNAAAAVADDDDYGEIKLDSNPMGLFSTNFPKPNLYPSSSPGGGFIEFKMVDSDGTVGISDNLLYHLLIHSLTIHNLTMETNMEKLYIMIKYRLIKLSNSDTLVNPDSDFALVYKNI